MLNAVANEPSIVQQGTLEWLKERSGYATGSEFECILAVDKRTGKQLLKPRLDYAMRLATERLYGAPIEGPQAASLQWGHDAEPYARDAAEIQTGEIIRQVGFMKHPTLPWVGCSVDGLIGVDGTYESKCPKNPTVHMKAWLSGEMPEEHIPQVQGQLWVTGRKWCMFVSYDPRAPKEFRLFVKHVARNDIYIATLEKEMKKFLAEVNLLIKTLKLKAKEAA
jgi:predicted phage-related endonuclease